APRPRFGKGVGGDDDVSQLLQHKPLSRRRRLGGSRRRSRGGAVRGRRRTAGSGLAAQNLEHDSAASRTFAFDSPAAILHHFLNGIHNLFFGFALNAISFGHNKILLPSALCASPVMEIPYGCPIHSVNCEKGAEKPQKTPLTGPPGF